MEKPPWPAVLEHTSRSVLQWQPHFGPSASCRRRPVGPRPQRLGRHTMPRYFPEPSAQRNRCGRGPTARQTLEGIDNFGMHGPHFRRFSLFTPSDRSARGCSVWNTHPVKCARASRSLWPDLFLFLAGCGKTPEALVQQAVAAERAARLTLGQDDSRAVPRAADEAEKAVRRLKKLAEAESPNGDERQRQFQQAQVAARLARQHCRSGPGTETASGDLEWFQSQSLPEGAGAHLLHGAAAHGGGGREGRGSRHQQVDGHRSTGGAPGLETRLRPVQSTAAFGRHAGYFLGGTSARKIGSTQASRAMSQRMKSLSNCQ